MLAERWREVRQILSAALELEPQARSAYCAGACAGDPDLRQEVESLLEGYEKRTSWLEQPAVSVLGLSPGVKLGAYEIEELIGAGGMGEVYKAHDSSLDRAVAIKVLPPMFSSDAARLRRFELEARAAAALNHPNILAVYQLGTHEGMLYIVSELLEGETLREQIKQGPLPIANTLVYGLQIASGLTAAHKKGIIHRDLKPENLFVTRDGQIKILDFGLAKAVETVRSSAHTLPPASERYLTAPGAVLGTTPYMSPEQVRGKEVAQQTDIFSFGVVLYEMTTGTLPFRGETAAVVCEAIMNRPPVSPSQLNPNVSGGLEAVITRALEKNPEQRYQHASEMRAELRQLERDLESHIPYDTPPPRRPTGTYPGTLSSPRVKWVLLGLAAAGVISVLSVRNVLQVRQTRTLGEKDSIVLADFSNKTGEPVFTDALKQGLTVDLEQSPFLNILSDDKISEQLRFMGRPNDTPLTPEVAREVCRRGGSNAELLGSIASLGTHYVITLKAVNCQNLDLLDEEQGEADRRENVLTQLHETGKRLRSKLGESLASIEKHDTPLIQATTSSLEALQAFSMASRTFHFQGSGPAVPLYKRAIGLDPNFAQAYADLATVYSNLKQYSLSAEYARRAYELRDKASELERFSIDSTWYQETGALDEEAQALEAWKQTYPRDLTPYINLGQVNSYLGQLDKALENDLQGLQIQSSNVVYADLAGDYLNLGRLDEAEAILQKAQKLKPDESIESMLPDSYQLAFLRDDNTEMARCLRDAVGKPGMEDALLASQSDTEAFHGRLAKARDLSRKALESALRNGGKETAAAWGAAAALREAEFGNDVEARRDAATALTLTSTKPIQIAAAMAFARTGEIVRAQSMVGKLRKQYPDDTLLANYWVPSIQAAIEIREKQPSRAIQYLQSAAPYELGGATPPFSAGATLYPAYLRGEAYLANQQWSQAAAEFQKILDHRGLVWNYPLAALAHLQIGRAYAGLHNQANARSEYQQFLNLWRDADPGLTILHAAKMEYSKLH
jgi:serine/threonine protein kinase